MFSYFCRSLSPRVHIKRVHRRLRSYLFATVLCLVAALCWGLGDEVVDPRQKRQEAERQINHLRQSELLVVKVPGVWEQQPRNEKQGCGHQQLPGGPVQDRVELFIKVCEARYSQESPHLYDFKCRKKIFEVESEKKNVLFCFSLTRK